jgi:hypothetical protein
MARIFRTALFLLLFACAAAGAPALSAGAGDPLARIQTIVVIYAENRSFDVSLRRRPPFLGRLDDRRWVIVVDVVMGSVHKLGYGHKFEGSAATSVVA